MLREPAFQLIFTTLHLWAASLHLAAARYHAGRIKPAEDDTYLAALERARTGDTRRSRL